MNANLLLGFRQPEIQPPDQPVNMLIRGLQVRGLMDQRDAAQRGLERTQRMENILAQQYARPEDRENAMLGGGFVDEAAKLTKNRVDAAKVEADTEKNRIDAAHKRIDAWGSVMGYVRQNPTAENAAAAVDHLVRLGVMPQEMAQGALAQLQSDPTPQGVSKFADLGFRAALAAKEQLPKNDVQNIGGQTIVQSIDAVTGRPSITGAVQNTQSPESRASVAAQIRGQNMTDSRQRELNQITRDLGVQEKELRIAELTGKLEDRNRQKQSGESSIAAQIGVIDKALSHSGRTTATGLSGSLDPRNYVPGTDATDFRAVLDQIGGAAFLQAYESLKGGGQITEVEGKKATDAIARLSRAQSDSEFEQSLRDLREVMTVGYSRLSGKQYPGPAPTGKSKPANDVKRVANDAEYNALPSGSVFVGPDGKQRRKP